MSRTLSSNYTQSANAQESPRCHIHLLTVTGDGLSEPLRICDVPHEVLPIAGVRGVVSRGAEFVYLPFEITLPSQDESGVSRVSLSIDNTNRQIVLAVEQAGGRLNATVELVLDNALDAVEIAINNLILERITYDAQSVTADVEIRSLAREPFPKGRIVPSLFPGIF